MRETTRFVDKPVDRAVEKTEASSPYLRLRLRSLAEVERDLAARDSRPRLDAADTTSFPRHLLSGV